MAKFIDIQDYYDEKERKNWNCHPEGCKSCPWYDDCLENCQDEWDQTIIEGANEEELFNMMPELF